MGMFSTRVDSNSISNIPSNDTILVENKEESEIMDLMRNCPQNEYGLNPPANMFLDHVSLKKSDFDNMFGNFKESIEKNIPLCSLKFRNKLKDWLGKKAQTAIADAECAFIEFTGYSEKDIETIENYFLYANERILDLIAYIDSQKPDS